MRGTVSTLHRPTWKVTLGANVLYSNAKTVYTPAVMHPEAVTHTCIASTSPPWLLLACMRASPFTGASCPQHVVDPGLRMLRSLRSNHDAYRITIARPNPCCLETCLSHFDRLSCNLTAMKCAGSIQDETSRAGCDGSTRYCRDSRALFTHWSTAAVSSDSCEEIGENRPTLSGPSLSRFCPYSRIAGRASPRQPPIPLDPHESKNASVHAATSGMHASRMRMQSVLSAYTKVTNARCPSSEDSRGAMTPQGPQSWRDQKTLRTTGRLRVFSGPCPSC